MSEPIPSSGSIPPVPSAGTAARALAWRALLAGWLVGAAYGAAAWFSPLAPLNMFLPVAAGAALGAWIAERAIVREFARPRLVVALALVAAAVGLYGAWGATVSLSKPPLFPRTFDPRIIAAYAEFQYERGQVQVEQGLEIRSYRGGGLVLLWIAEAIGFAGASGFAAAGWYRHAAPTPCERCGGWLQTHFGWARLAAPPDDAGGAQRLGERLRTGDYAALEELPDATIDDDPHVRVDVSGCWRCRDRCLTSAAWVSYTAEPGEVGLVRDADVPFDLLERLAAGSRRPMTGEHDEEEGAEGAA